MRWFLHLKKEVMGPVVAMLQANPVDPTLRIFLVCNSSNQFSDAVLSSPTLSEGQFFAADSCQTSPLVGQSQTAKLVTLPVLTNFIPAADIHLG